MKYLGVILVVVVALVAGQVLGRRINEKDSQVEHIRSKRSINDKLRSFLENLKTVIREGNTTMGIPVLDPFRSEKIVVELDENVISGSGEGTNVVVTGIADYNIDKAEIAILSRKVTIALTWPHIYSNGSYNLNATALDDLKVFGNGDYIVTLTNLSFKSTVWIGITGGVKVKKMETQISLGGLDLSATGLFGDDDTSKIVSEVISDAAPQIIQDYQKELTSAINEEATKLVNEFLDGKTLAEIIGILG